MVAHSTKRDNADAGRACRPGRECGTFEFAPGKKDVANLN